MFCRKTEHNSFFLPSLFDSFRIGNSLYWFQKEKSSPELPAEYQISLCQYTGKMFHGGAGYWNGKAVNSNRSGGKFSA